MSLLDIVRQITRLLYHAGRSKVDRRHQLKWSTEFTKACAVMNQSRLDEDELADAIIELADQFEYSETELAEATYYLAAAGLDEDIPDALPRVVELAEFGQCDLSNAAESLPTLLLLFDQDPDGASSMVRDIVYLTSSTKLTVRDVAHISETVAPLAWHHGKSFPEIAADISAVCEKVGPFPYDDYAADVRIVLKEQYYKEKHAEQRAGN